MKKSDNKSGKVKKALVWSLSTVITVLVLYPLLACLYYPSDYVFRALAWGESSVYDYLELPSRPLKAGAIPFYFDQDLQEAWVRAIFESDPQIDDLDSFLADTGTQAFIVIQDDRILYEEYFNGAQRDSVVTSFSAAKSFTSALIGAAIDDGFIGSVDDPITHYLPELVDRDARFGDVTIRDLLMMSSGIRYSDGVPLLSDDGTKTYLYTDMRQLALGETRIKEPPGSHFLYNNYNPLLLGVILERSTGVAVTEYLQQKIWGPLGMEFDGSWSLDSEESGFEKMESGINARAIDFAKFGRLFLHKGYWDGAQVIPADWIAESTQEDPSVDRDEYYRDFHLHQTLDGFYKYMWWGLPRGEGEYDFSAVGKYGQYIYVSPAANLIIVRNGERYGVETDHWMRLFFQLASAAALRTA